MTRAVRYGLLVILLAAGAFVGGPGTARAEPIAVGLLDFSQFIPGSSAAPGTVAFYLTNYTGSNSLAPDFPVLDSLTFLGAQLHVHGRRQDLTVFESVVPLGDVTPGALLASGYPLPSLQFADTWTFTSVRFTASLDRSSFRLVGGTAAESYSPVIADLRASPGGFITLGTYQPLTVELVPEPTTLLLLGSGLAAVGWRRRQRQ